MDLIGSIRTVDATLTREVLDEHTAVHHWWRLVDQTVFLSDGIAGEQP
jgi:hypothetical protein